MFEEDIEKVLNGDEPITFAKSVAPEPTFADALDQIEQADREKEARSKKRRLYRGIWVATRKDVRHWGYWSHAGGYFIPLGHTTESVFAQEFQHVPHARLMSIYADGDEEVGKEV